MCATSGSTSDVQCAYDFARFIAIADDQVTVSCPNGSAVADTNVSRTLPVTLQGGEECTFFVTQLGCEARTSVYCLVDMRANAYPSNVTFEWPVWEARSLMNFRAIGRGWSSQTIYYQYVTGINATSTGAASVTVRRGQSYGPYIIGDAIGLFVRITCSQTVLPPTPPRLLRIQTCTDPGNQLQFFASVPRIPDSLISSGISSINLYSDDPNAYFEPIQGSQICVTSNVTKISSCGYDVVTARDIVQGDRILVTFPDPRPPAPNMQNNIPVQNGNCRWPQCFEGGMEGHR